MEFQTILNFLLGSLSAILGWLGRELWGAVQELRKDLKEIRVDITANYVRKDDFREFKRELMESLHRIEDKLDHKIDK